MNKKTLILPFLAMVLFAVFLSALWNKSDPRDRGSVLIDQPAPKLDLPDLMIEGKRYTNEVFIGKTTLLNVWGVWCVTCAVELPFLTQLRDQGFHIVGLYYDQDIDPDFGGKAISTIRREVTSKLGQLGDPYAFNILDEKREYALDLGITGAPETFLIDKKGIVRLHHIGDINERVWRNKFAPKLAELQSL